MSVFVKHAPCKKCGSRDNTGIYADGSSWCFGCGDYNPPEGSLFNPREQGKHYDELVQLESDLCNDFPGHVVAWLGKYGISVEEGLKHGWKYCPSRDQLVFIFRDSDGRVLATQARNFWAGSKIKYFTQGSVEQILPIMGRNQETASRICIVEDTVSAAKIARQASSMPLLGSTLSNSKLARLGALKPQQMVFWLDYDKWTSAVRMADRAKMLGITTKVVQSKLDPKEYSDAEITSKIS